MRKLQELLDDLTSGEDTRAEGAVPSLAALSDAAIQPLLDLLQHSEADHRWWATRALAALPHPLASQGLRQALLDPDPTVRQCAALGLRLRPSQEAIPPLISALQDPDRLLARLAADALAALGSSAIPKLAQAAKSPNPAVRIEAVRALALMEEEEAIPLLFSALEDRSAMVAYWAEHGLDNLGVGMMFFEP